MTFQVQRIGDSYGVLFTEDQMRSAGLYEGTHVDIQPHPSEDASLIRPGYVAMEAGMRAFKQCESKWSAAYEELAK